MTFEYKCPHCHMKSIFEIITERVYKCRACKTVFKNEDGKGLVEVGKE